MDHGTLVSMFLNEEGYLIEWKSHGNLLFSEEGMYEQDAVNRLFDSVKSLLYETAAVRMNRG